MPSVRDPHNVTIGSQAVTDVLTIDYGLRRTPIQGRSDDDVYDTVAEYGGGSVGGVVTFRDAVQAKLFSEQQGDTLTANFKATGGGADKVLTITGVSTGAYGGSVVRDGISTFAVPFVAASSDGTTNPVSIA